MLHKTVIATSLLAMAAVVAMAAVGSGPKASGHVQITVGGGKQTYSFNAITDSDGEVKGHLNLNSRGQEVKVFGEVDCLVVTGNQAIVGGVIKKSDGADLEGARFAFRVIDNGEGKKGGPDAASDVVPLNPASPPCVFAPSPDPTADANIQVKPDAP
jgi:hypothetical protein